MTDILSNKECKFEGVEFSHLSTDPLHPDLLGGFSVSVKETFSSLDSAWISAEYLLCKNMILLHQ